MILHKLVKAFAFAAPLLAIFCHNPVWANSPKPDSLILAWENAPRAFDPRYAIDAESQYLEDLLHCALINFNPDGGITGELVKSWTWINDKTLSMDIKEQILFADGSVVSPEDVKATYEFFAKKDLKHPTPRAGAFKNIKAIEVKGQSITFTLLEPDAAFLSNLVVGILPRKQASEDILSNPLEIKGCGPYILKKEDLTSLTLAANPRYTLGSKPKTANVEIKFVKDETTRLAKIRKGEIDIAQNNISLDAVESIPTKYPDLKVLKRPSLKTTYIGFNIQDEILKNAKVRKAISLAINRADIIKYLLKGMALSAMTMLPPDHAYYNKSLPSINYDPEQAKKLLDEAGFKLVGAAKQRFTLTYKTTHNDTRIAIAKAVASDLMKVGINVAVMPLEWGRFKADVDLGHVQIWGLAWVGYKDPDIYRYAFATESFPPDGGNRGRFSHKEVDELLQKGKMATDESARKKIYARVQEILFEEAPYAFLFHEENYAVIRKPIQGFEIYADGRYSSLKDTYKSL